jgi:hypothetical protein
MALAFSLLFICVLCHLIPLSRAAPPTSYVLVDVRSENTSAVLVGVAAAAGLANRRNASVYVLRTADDVAWAGLLLANSSQHPVSAADFLTQAYTQFGALLYDDNANASALLPTVVTLAGALDLVPLGASVQSRFPGAQIAFNAVGAWASPEDAVRYAATAALNVTTSLAFQDPVLIATGQLVDWLVARRIFTLYLNNSCYPDTEDHAILLDVLGSAPWSLPVRVYGYNSIGVLFGGDLFEAETDCVDTMGQIASANTHNLAFWSQIDRFDPRQPPGSPLGPMIQPKQAPIVYNASRTYVALVYGGMCALI